MRTPRHRNSTRDRERGELKVLRSLVSDLETHLDGLSHRDQVKLQSSKSWRCFSERQLHARHVAEQTNRTLSDRVQSNADWIHRLWELLHEKRRAAEVSTLRRLGVLHQKSEDNEVLRRLLHQTELAAPKLLDVLSANGISIRDMEATDMWSHVQTGDLQSTLLCVRRFPFDVHSTSAAIWMALSCPEIKFQGGHSSSFEMIPQTRVLERTPSVCKMKFHGGTLDKFGAFVPLNYHSVVQRTEVTKPHHINVFTWQSLCALTVKSVKHFDTMWIAVTRCPLGGLESIVTLVCQSQSENVMENVKNAQDLQIPIRQRTDACISAILSCADDILLQESCNGVVHASLNSGDSLIQNIDV